MQAFIFQKCQVSAQQSSSDGVCVAPTGTSVVISTYGGKSLPSVIGDSVSSSSSFTKLSSQKRALEPCPCSSPSPSPKKRKTDMDNKGPS